MSSGQLLPCPGCGAPAADLPGRPRPELNASAGCWELFCRVLGKEFGDYAYPVPAHQLTVAAYWLQHPGEPGPAAAKRVHGHLLTLCLLLEREMPVPSVARALERLRHEPELPWLAPPASHGTPTVADVLGAQSLAEHCRLVDAWARGVWSAWAPCHPRIRLEADRLLRD